MAGLTDQEQYDELDHLLFRYGPGTAPWELKVRDLARQAVLNPETYSRGTYYPVLLPRAFVIQDGDGHLPPSRVLEIHVRLIPALRDRPDHALLIAERTIRRQTAGL